MSKYYQIAVDGFSSCGKSTLAKQIANVIGALYIDSGAMYRAATVLALKNNCMNEKRLNVNCFRPIMMQAKIDFETETKHILLNGEDVEKEIRTPYVANYVSEVAKHGFVRELLVQMQRSYNNKSSVVMDGRDIGTHVFPQAEVKLFLTAKPEIRAERRFKELQEKSIETSYDEVLKNIQNRDEIDQNREIAPLRKAEDAIEIDNSYLTRKEQLERAIKIISLKINTTL